MCMPCAQCALCSRHAFEHSRHAAAHTSTSFFDVGDCRDTSDCVALTIASMSATADAQCTKSLLPCASCVWQCALHATPFAMQSASAASSVALGSDAGCGCAIASAVKMTAPS